MTSPLSLSPLSLSRLLCSTSCYCGEMQFIGHSHDIRAVDWSISGKTLRITALQRRQLLFLPANVDDMNINLQRRISSSVCRRLR